MLIIQTAADLLLSLKDSVEVLCCCAADVGLKGRGECGRRERFGKQHPQTSFLRPCVDLPV